MTNDIREAYEKYITIGQQIKALTAQRAAAQQIIKNYHTTSGRQLITEDGFKSQIIVQTTRALDEGLLLTKFGEEALADCYSTHQKTNFRCDRLING